MFLSLKSGSCSPLSVRSHSWFGSALIVLAALLLVPPAQGQGVFLKKKQTAVFAQFGYADKDGVSDVAGLFGCAFASIVDVGVGVGRLKQADKGITYIAEQASVYVLHQWNRNAPYTDPSSSLPVSLSIDQGYAAVFGEGTSGESQSYLGGTVYGHVFFNRRTGLVPSVSLLRYLQTNEEGASKTAIGLSLSFFSADPDNVFTITLSHLSAGDEATLGIGFGINFIQSKKKIAEKSDWDN